MTSIYICLGFVVLFAAVLSWQVWEAKKGNWVWHIDERLGSDTNLGSYHSPFKTHARLNQAMAGLWAIKGKHTVFVHQGPDPNLRDLRDADVRILPGGEINYITPRGYVTIEHGDLPITKNEITCLNADIKEAIRSSEEVKRGIKTLWLRLRKLSLG